MTMKEDEIQVADKTVFPQQICYQQESNCPVILGSGIRSKKILGLKEIKAYAVAFYAQKTGVLDILKSYFKPKSDSEKPDQSILDKLSNAVSVDRTLRIVVTSGTLTKKRFVNALEERLKDTMAKASQSQVLQSYFDSYKDDFFKVGTQIDIIGKKQGKVITLVNGNKINESDSEIFQQGFFDIYLGGDAVAPRLKEQVSGSLLQLAKPV